MFTQDTSNITVGGYPLSFQQQRVWSEQPDAKVFRAQCAVFIDGPADAGLLRAAVRKTVERHEILRTTFQSLSGYNLPFQVVREFAEFDWQERPAPGWDSDAGGQEFNDLLLEQASRPFDLESGPLLRVLLLNVRPERRLLLLSLPALCADAVTLRNLVGEIGRAYAVSVLGGELGEEPLAYAEFMAWQAEGQQGEEESESRRGRTHWARQRSFPVSPVPSSFGDGAWAVAAEPTVKGFALDPPTTARLGALAERLEVSERAVLLASWQAFVWRLTAGANQAVGELVDGRTYEEFLNGVGLYARLLPLGVNVRREQSFSGFALQVHDLHDKAAEWEEYAGFEEPHDYPIGFEYNDWRVKMVFAGLSFSLARQHVWLRKFQAKLTCARTPEALLADLYLHEGLAREMDIGRMVECYTTFLRAALESPETTIATLPLISEQERQALFDFNDSTESFAPALCVHRLFEEQVKLTPDATAVIFGGRRLTYDELNQRANQVAHYLLANGLFVEQRVGIFLERSADLLVGLLGILKAGGAYVPLDPNSPAERISKQLIDADIGLVLTEERYRHAFPPGAGACLVPLEGEAIASHGRENPSVEIDGTNLVYVLFTSGSTGRPKGAAVEHRQLFNYVQAVRSRLDMPRGAGFALVSTFAADLGNTMIYPALCGGGCLHIIPEETAVDPVAFGEYLQSQEVDCLKIVPSHLSALLLSGRPQNLLPRRLLVLGGEATPWSLVEKVREVAPRLRILNHYGPTETTVGVITLELEQPPSSYRAAILPLNAPLANCQIYLLDAGLQPVPRGLPGEICVGGEGLARGYIGQPRETAEKFVPNPLSRTPGERLYRTGDLARFLPDGTIEFQGRADNQVKIRGFRVELGEIEAALRNHEQVWASVVVVRDGQLVAYVVPQRNSEPTQADLKQFLKGRLPAHMHPSSVVLLDALPLTANGKIDRAALPAPEHARPASTQIIEPRTPNEKALADIWAEVLKVPRLGIHDNFFEVGGDSILAIQVAAKSTRVGLRVTPRQIFDSQTIARLALVAGTGAEVQAEQGLVTGAVPLVPVQSWFFEQNLVEPHHWNQSLLLKLPDGIGPGLLKTAASALIRHHDALRLRFRGGPERWRQSVAGPEDVDDSFSLFEFSALPAGEREKAVESAAGKLQASLNLSDGPIARFAYFDLGGGGADRLLIIIHHLAVDGVSWRVLVEDLQTACEQLSRGESIVLPAKTSSFKQWAERLAEHVATGKVDEELPFWLRLADGHRGGLDGDVDGANTYASARSAVVSLDAEETRTLLQDLPEVYGTKIDEILLTAIVRGVASTTGATSLCIDLEGHGREEIFDDLDISRTVGWFTTHYPVLLDIGGADGLPGSLKLVKEQLRAVPGRGLGYGLLKYLSPRREVSEMLKAQPAREIKYNYLGQFDQVFGASGGFAVAGEAPGPERSARAKRTHLLDINGFVLGGKLCLRWTYGEGVHSEARIRELAQAVMRELRALLVWEAFDESELYSPSDFPLARLDDAQIKQVLLEVAANFDGDGAEGAPKGRGVEDIYPVSPLQESLLFQRLSAHGSGAGFEQKDLLLSGALDSDAFDTAWREVVRRHPILRTVFVTAGTDGPLQIVFRRARLPIEHLDWRHLPTHEQRRELGFRLREDRERGFDPTRAPLMRLAVIQLAEDAYHVVWSYDHLLLDAWCRNLLLQEVFALYRAYRDRQDLRLPDRPPYRDYIAWLQKQDTAAAEEFWREALKGFSYPNRLPVIPPTAPAGTTAGTHKTWFLTFTEVESALVASSVRRSKLTLNTLVHAAWALLLSRYCDTVDVLFGTTVSGRPAEVEGVELMLGMFINNLPVRVRLSGREQVSSMLTYLQNQLARLREYEWVLPAKLQEWSEVPQGQRLFESLLIFQNYPYADASVEAETGVRIVESHSRLESAYPLTVVVGPVEPLTIRIFYDTKQFDDPTIERLAAHLKTLLNGLAADPEALLSEVPMLTEAERRQLLPQPDDVEQAAESSHIDDLIERKVRESPHEVAVRWREERLLWEELGRRAAGLSLRLAEAGVGPNSTVAVILGRSLEFPVTLLATLKLGAGLVVLDPADSKESILLRLRETRAAVALTTGGLVEHLKDLPLRLVIVDSGHRGSDDVEPQFTSSDEESAAVPLACDSALAPFITHDMMCNQAQGFVRALRPAPHDALLATSGALSALAVEVIRALASGTAVIIPDAHVLSDAARLREALEDTGATIAQAPQHVWRTLLETGWRGGRDLKLIVPGKTLGAWLVRELSSAVAGVAQIYKADDPELWLAGCGLRGEPDGGGANLFDSSLPGFKTYILSLALEPLPVGLTGEVYVGDFGTGEPRMNDATDAPQRFVPNPFDGERGSWLYRTGDLARRREDGRIEFRGEASRLVVIDGEQINLGEVEVELMKLPVLREAALKTWEDALGDVHLVAYFVADYQALPGVEELLKLLRKALRRRAVPDLFVRLDALPARPDGKVDYEALPPPDEAADKLEIPYVAPCDPLQLHLKQIWEDLFGIRPIDIKDSFFDLGGHSILAARLMIEIRKQFGRDLPMATLLQGGTIEHLSDVLRSEIEYENWTPLVGIQTGGDRPPLFCVHAMGGEVLCYAELARCLGPDQPFYALQSRAWFSDEEFDWRVEDMAARYLEALRAVQTEGPYRIAGWSFGGLVALEMAQQLYAAGESVALLAIFDTNLQAHLDSQSDRDGGGEEGSVDWDSAKIIIRFARRNCRASVDEVRRQGGLEEQLAYAIEKGILPPGLDVPTGLRYARAGLSNTRAKSRYVAKPYPGTVTLFRANRGHILTSTEEALGWERIALGGVVIHDIAGEHDFITEQPYVQTLARELRKSLDRAQDAHAATER